MTNTQRRQIVDEAKSRGYQGSYVDLFRQAALNVDDVVQASTQAGIDGLRPAHQAGNTDASMAFTDVPPNTPFNTVGMKAPIDIKKYDKQGHLVKSYESVPPGIQSLNTGPSHGTVVETPARMQEGGKIDESTATPEAYRKAQKESSVKQYKETPTELLVRRLKEQNSKEDSTFENFIEAFDPTGVSSWDDAYRAITAIRGGKAIDFDKALDIYGAIPLAGKTKPVLNFAKKSLKPLKHYGTNAYNYVRKNYGNIMNRSDAIEDETGFLDKFQEGGEIDESLDAATLERYLADTRGQTPQFWKATADTLAFHESGPHQRMDPKAVQTGGGPGRGLLQFEPEAFNTAKVRYKQIAELRGLQPDPEIMKATSADQLSADQQYALFYSDMIQGKVKLSDYAQGKLPLVDLWLQGHKKVEAHGDRESFEESRQAAKKELKNYGLRLGGVRYNNSRYKR